MWDRIRRVIACAILACTVGPAAVRGAPSTAPTAAEAAYVISQSDSRVDVLGLDPPRHLGAISLGRSARDLAVSPDGRWVAAPGRDAVAFLDTQTFAKPLEVAHPAGTTPLAFHTNDGTLWVARAERTPDWRVIGGYGVDVFGEAPAWRALARLGLEGPVTALAFTPDGKTALVAARAGLHLIDTATRTVRAVARTKRNANQVVVSPDGRHAYVMNGPIDTVYVVDIADGSVVADLQFPAMPQEMALAPDGKRLFVSLGDFGFNAPKDGGRVAVVDCGRHEQIASLPVGERPYAMALGADARTLFVGDSSAKQLAVVDVVDGKVAKAIELPGRPIMVRRAPGSDLVVALCPEAGKAVLLRGASGEVAASLPIGRGALFVGFAPAGEPTAEAFKTAPPAPPDPMKPPVRPAPAGDANPPAVKVVPARLPGYDPAAKGVRWETLPVTLPIVDDPDAQQLARVAPKRVTLGFKNALPHDVVAELARQTGYKFVARDPRFWETFTAPVSITARDVPVWAALTELRARTLIDFSVRRPGRFDLTGPHQADPRNWPLIVSGAFRVTARGGARRAGGELIGGKPHARYELSVWHEAEPGLYVVRTARAPTVVEAVDGDGVAFVPHRDASGGTMEWGRPMAFNVILHRPSAHKGGVIKRVRGVGHLLAATDVATVRVDAPLTHAGGKHEAGGLRFSIAPATREPQRGAIGARHVLRVTFPRENRTDRQWDQLRSLASACRVRLLTAAGDDLQPEENAEDTPDAFTHVIRVPADAGRDPWFAGDPATLLIEVPTRLVEVDVPFAFEDVPVEEAR